MGDKVRVLGEGYSLEDREDASVCEITKIWIFQGRYRVEVNRVTAGNWALFEGCYMFVSPFFPFRSLSRMNVVG